MKSHNTLLLASLIVFSTNALAYQQLQQESSISSGGTISQTYPTTTTTTATPVRDTSITSVTDVQVSSSSSQTSASSAPQFGVRDMKVTSDGKCKIGSNSRAWAGSPCAKVYGPTAPTQSASAGTGTGTSIGSVYDSAVKSPTYSNTTSSSTSSTGINSTFSSPTGLVRDESTQTYQSDTSTSSPTSTYSTTREAFY